MRHARVRPRVRACGLFLAAAVGCLLAGPVPLAAQAADSVVWVYLSPDSMPSGSAALGEEAFARRARLGIPAFDNDAALPEARIRELERAGLVIRHRSRWLRAVSGSADASALARIRALGFVRRITPVARLGIPPVPGPQPAAGELNARVAPPDSFYGRSLAQVRQIGVPAAHELGFTGAGVRVAMLDTGFELDHVALSGLNVVATYDFIQGDSIVSNQPGDAGSQSDHGTRVWSMLGGHAPNEFIGPAYGAEFLLAKVDDVPTEPRADEDRWVAALEWADSLGAEVVSSSLGYLGFDDGFSWGPDDLNGDITPTTIAADEAAKRGILIVNSAGNEGPGARTLIAPADADSILAVGAVNALGALAAFSSRGPTADGRIKPDLVARGVAVVGASANSPTDYVTGNGTSFAAPLVGGGAALFVEAWPELGAMAALRALQLSGSIQPPNDSMGHGVPDIASAILFPQGLRPLPTPGTGQGDRLATLSPSFAWSVPVLHPLARPVRYRVQIADDASFAVILVEDTVIDAQVITLSRPLPSDPSLFWRVIAETATGVVRISRSTGPFEMQSWVTLTTLNQPEGVFITDATPVLAWNPLPATPPVGPLEFDVEIFAAASGEVLQRFTDISDTSLVVPQPLPFNVPLRWRVIVRTASGASDTVLNAAPFVVVSSSAPPVTLLYQNFPNPFPRAGIPETTIWFDLAQQTRVTLAVYDLRGRLVRRLIPDRRQGCTEERMQLAPGPYGRDSDPTCVETSWDAHTDAGESMPAGIYVIRLITDQGAHTVRVLYRP